MKVNIPWPEIRDVSNNISPLLETTGRNWSCSSIFPRQGSSHTAELFRLPNRRRTPIKSQDIVSNMTSHPTLPESVSIRLLGTVAWVQSLRESTGARLLTPEVSPALFPPFFSSPFPLPTEDAPGGWPRDLRLPRPSSAHFWPRAFYWP